MQADVLGFDVEFPEGTHAVHSIVVAEVVDMSDHDDPSDLSLIVRMSPDMPVWKMIGMLDSVLAQLRHEFMAGYIDGE